jgi:hypothetical protein
MAEIKYFGSFEHDQERTPSPLSPDDQKRLDVLLIRKDSERLERERVAWRKASEPPQPHVSDQWTFPHPSTPAASAQPPKADLGFFARLKLGKFLE